MTITTNLGFPRIGQNRELKKAVEGYWAGTIAREELLQTAAMLRARHWKLQQQAGIDQIPSNDFSLYDHVLDTAIMVNAVPERFRGISDPLDLLFAMARGTKNAPPCEMTKWFNTNYHYLVPEITDATAFRLNPEKPLAEFTEARALGIHTRPVLLSPASFLRLSTGPRGKGTAMNMLGYLLPAYVYLLRKLVEAGADWIQIDEPILALDLTQQEQFAIQKTYACLRTAVPEAKIFLASYFGSLGDNRDLALQLPVQALHLDLVATSTQEFGEILKATPRDKTLSLGLVDGRNVWRTNVYWPLTLAGRAVEALGSDHVWIGPSCSLLHVPVDLEPETALPEDVKSWLSFGVQKLTEIRTIATALDDPNVYNAAVREWDAVIRSREASALVTQPEAWDSIGICAKRMRNRTPFGERRALQQRAIPLPPLPTTMIGSLPQTRDMRKLRKELKEGKVHPETYQDAMRDAVRDAIRWQEEQGLDVLVHGEPERNDMVEYFADKLHGFVFTKHGWVQSYGSRCVKPPIIVGDVARKHPMTVEWTAYAQSLTPKPVKGMLTGPLTMLKWSFVRNDIQPMDVCLQIASALQDEVLDLEQAGIRVIQVDEPALREGLPLRRADQRDYLDWAVGAFRLATSAVQPETQIHTHMCYADVEDILDAIRRMDADVISLEASRSAMELLRTFRGETYPNDVGPGVYDIHSPRVPTVPEIEGTIRTILEAFPKERIWVNPDCGLKTRRWDEVRPAIQNMVAAAHSIRAGL